MKKDFLILTFALVILALSHTISSAQVLHDWLEPNPDGNDGYTWASTSKYAEVTYTSVIGFSPASYWALTASASADASADPLGADTSYDATAWCQTTADLILIRFQAGAIFTQTGYSTTARACRIMEMSTEVAALGQLRTKSIPSQALETSGGTHFHLRRHAP